MDAKDVLRNDVQLCFQIATPYLSELTDDDLFVRPVPGANHLAWQLGHLITSSRNMLQGLGQPAPELPAGFAEAHTKETAASDDRAGFADLATYRRLLEETHAASLAAIEAFPADQLDAPGPEPMREYLPTNAAVLSALGSHWMMHVGQFSIIRRKLGHPPLF
jgi:hypothetical protein